MKKSTLLVYIGYYWTKTLIGLTFHPYFSVKETLRRPILLPVIFAPILGLTVLIISSTLGSFFIKINGDLRGVVALTLSSVFFAIVFWQILLLYLLFTFIAAKIRK